MTQLGLAGVLGGIAQNHAAIWPDIVVLILAIAAALASLSAPASETRRAVEPRLHSVPVRSRSLPTVAPAVSLQAA